MKVLNISRQLIAGTFYHCVYLECQDTLGQQNDGLVTVEGLFYCNNRR